MDRTSEDTVVTSGIQVSGESQPYTLLRFPATQGARQCYHQPHRPEEESDADELAQATLGFNLILPGLSWVSQRIDLFPSASPCQLILILLPEDSSCKGRYNKGPHIPAQSPTVQIPNYLIPTIWMDDGH